MPAYSSNIWKTLAPMSQLTFTMTNNVGLWVLDTAAMQYARAYGVNLSAINTTSSLQFQFADAAGVVLETYNVQKSPLTSSALPLPCTLTVTMLDLPVGIKTGVVIAVQQFGFGGPGASAGNIFYPSPAFQAITTAIVGPDPSAGMAVTCTGAGYFSNSALNTAGPSSSAGFLVQFVMSGFKPDKQFVVSVAGGDATAQTPNSTTTPFVGASFVLSAGTSNYQLFCPATTIASGALALAADTGPVFTFSSGAHYKATVGLMTEQFASNPIVDDTGVQCGVMQFAAASTAVNNSVMAFKLTGSG